MYPSPSSYSGFFDDFGRYTVLQCPPNQYHAEYEDSLPQQRTPALALPKLHWIQERYLGVSSIVVNIGAAEVDRHIHKIPMVARVSIVDYRGHVVLDTYVHPTHPIEDYRSEETGLRHQDLMDAPSFQDVQLRVADTIKNKIIVGHSLWNFLSVLGLSHPTLHTRDLALFRPIRKKLKSHLIVSLPTLVHIYMGRKVGMGYEDSLELARAAIDLFRSCEQFKTTMIPSSFNTSTNAFMDNQVPLAYPPASSLLNGQPSKYQDQRVDDTPQLPLSDSNKWYYPSHGYESDDGPLEPGSRGGNWGNKTVRGARWVRKGKMTTWGPSMDDWESEERARKRIKLLLPQERRSPSPPSLPHLERSPSPPLVSPYPPPDAQHLSYASFVMDKAVTHSFRSNLIDELENATNGLIEGEATMNRAMGRLWQVINEDPENMYGQASVIPKQEDGDGDAHEEEAARRMARAPDLTPPMHKIFLLSYPSGGPQVFEPSHFASPDMQLETLEKSLATLRELHDDGREYGERLQEIRDSLGDVRAQRDGVWDLVRERAVKELHDVAYNATG